MDLVQFKIFPFNGKLQLKRTAPYFPRHNQRDQYIYHIKSPSIEATMAPARSQPSKPHIANLTLPSTLTQIQLTSLHWNLAPMMSPTGIRRHHRISEQLDAAPQ
jgi:hypothetical protein